MNLRAKVPGLCGLFLAAVCGACLMLQAADPVADSVDKDYSAELPRIEPLEPEQALASMRTVPGFRVELVAAEPLVSDPVAAAFDEDGRLYVVEMRGYSENRDEGLSRVHRLEDTDGDGRFDRGTVFLDGLLWPTAVACYAGGVFVADAPRLDYCKDTDGDGRADLRRTVYEGFSTSNVQGLVNSLQWGLDNRIYGSASSTGGEITTVATPQELWGGDAASGDASPAGPVSLRGRDFAFDPRTLAFETTSGGAQHGLSFDDWGVRYVCSNSDHLQQIMYEEADLARNPFLVAPGARQSIAADGPQAEVFRISPVEPWRLVRTRLRVSGVVPGIVEGGGRAAGYFTSATGTTIYRGDAWDEKLRGVAIIGDVGSNIVHRKRIDRRGIQHVAERIDQGVELLASTDVWFRPCQFINAPDGTLHILDVYREVIEHPASLPPVIKKHLDLTNGRDRGRIYRLVPEGYRHRPAPKLSQATTAELVGLLEHANGWHVDTAARLIYERRDPEAQRLLADRVQRSPSAIGRMRALYALNSLAALEPATLLRAMADADPGVRRHAVRIARHRAGAWGDVRARLVAMAGDDDLHVRYEVAFALGDLPTAERIAPLVELARRDAADRWMRVAIQSSLAESGEQVLAQLLADGPFCGDVARRPLLVALAEQAAGRGAKADMAVVLPALEHLPPELAATRFACVLAYRNALARRGQALADAIPEPRLLASAQALVERLVDEARSLVDDQRQSPATRAEAVPALALRPFVETREVFARLLASQQPQVVQVAAVKALARYDDAAVAEVLLEAWPGLGPRLRVEAAELLFGRKPWSLALLAAIEAQSVRPGDFEPARLRQLKEHSDSEIRSRAEAVLADVQLARRQEVVDAYRECLELKGDAARGREVFKKICAACHKAEGAGHELGPSLATVQNRGAEAILLNVLDPNREVNPQFVNYTLVTSDGRAMTGMLTTESATSVTLTRAEAASDTILRTEIEELRSTGLSLMPEGLEQQIDRQAMADLIAYLLSLR
ncbi:MAG: c-type cytochrome [Pirellulales bacterium]|nr:c-type cytochrome [Pirellulales bacterium]